MADKCTAAGEWPPAVRFFGLHIDFGEYRTEQGAWRYFPRAVWSCRYGCEFVAVGRFDVADLTEHLDQACPHAPSQARPTRKTRTRKGVQR
ncbi:hypothetical protein AB0D38_36860 [Streptomyces sp. NPDC048279]|uniref:hypothetical protein n=1 Tax=Streptomyces sp. NPDC048279 TaxID=3154714 RepID=UPI00343FDC41